MYQNILAQCPANGMAQILNSDLKQILDIWDSFTTNLLGGINAMQVWNEGNAILNENGSILHFLVIDINGCIKFKRGENSEVSETDISLCVGSARRNLRRFIVSTQWLWEKGQLLEQLRIALRIVLIQVSVWILTDEPNCCVQNTTARKGERNPPSQSTATTHSPQGLL